MTPANQLVIAKKSFAHLDSNGQGYVNQKEFVEAMLRQAVSSGMSKEDAEQLYSELKDEFKNLDANNDGRLDFNEFKSILGLDEYSGFPSGASGKPPNLRSPSGKTSPSPQAKVEDNKAEENGQERTVSLNITQTPIAVPRSSSHHGSAAILRVALNIHDPGTTVSSGLSLSGFKSPSMPRVGFSPNLQPNFNSNEQEDASPTPSPFPFLAGGQVPGFVPSPNASIERQPSTKEQYLAKNNAMAAAAMTAAVAATRVVTSHSRSETEESFRYRSTSNLPTKVSEELPEDFAEDGSVVQRVSETMVLSPSGRWLSNVTASTRTLKKESSGDPFTEEIEGVTSQRNSRNQPLSTQGPSKQVSSKQGSFVRIQEPERIGVLPAEG